MSKSSYDFKKYKVDLVTNLRLEVNRLAKERHGKASNALATNELDKILDELIGGKFAGLKTQSQSPTVSGCTEMSFPYTANKRDGSGVDDYAIYTVKSDCDYRFYYSGYKVYIDPDNTNSSALVTALGGHTGRYSETTFTRIILGANRVWFFCGDTNGVNIEML